MCRWHTPSFHYGTLCFCICCFWFMASVVTCCVLSCIGWVCSNSLRRRCADGIRTPLCLVCRSPCREVECWRCVNLWQKCWLDMFGCVVCLCVESLAGGGHGRWGQEGVQAVRHRAQAGRWGTTVHLRLGLGRIFTQGCPCHSCSLWWTAQRLVCGDRRSAARVVHWIWRNERSPWCSCRAGLDREWREWRSVVPRRLVLVRRRCKELGAGSGSVTVGFWHLCVHVACLMDCLFCLFVNFPWCLVQVFVCVCVYLLCVCLIDCRSACLFVCLCECLWMFVCVCLLVGLCVCLAFC